MSGFDIDTMAFASNQKEYPQKHCRYFLHISHIIGFFIYKMQNYNIFIF